MGCCEKYTYDEMKSLPGRSKTKECKCIVCGDPFWVKDTVRSPLVCKKAKCNHDRKNVRQQQLREEKKKTKRINTGTVVIYVEHEVKKYGSSI
jgi:hypothetical protein